MTTPFDPHLHHVSYPLPIDRLTVTYLRGTSTRTGYHQTWFRVTTTQRLSDTQWRGLFASGALGVGQSFRVESETVVPIDVAPVTTEIRTGIERREIVPVTQRPHWSTEYYVYDVVTLCDSGD